MYNRLSNYLTKYNLLTFSQHGFSAFSSTTTAFVDVMSYLNAAVSNNCSIFRFCFFIFGSGYCI